ncbi:MAG: sigma-70 family RNA polymerase sigma factor [Acidobacteria bacterium]|nr:sigma-70 family RNA polymerase sigma factor [Acidobacteriota bacterium]
MPQTDAQAVADEELVGACVAGDRSAFDLLVGRHQRQIYKLCFRFVGNHEDASELAQDAFVRAYRALPKFERTAKFTTWLHRIAVNVCLNRLSVKRPPHEPFADVESAPSRDERADVAVLRQERAVWVRAAVARLPQKQRATLILRAYHDLPHDEIARIMGSSVSAAKANFCHALGNLKKLLGERVVDHHESPE